MNSGAVESTTFSPYQKFIVAILATLQFTIILDFMILSPLGAMLMPALDATPQQFGLVVSAYAFSAGISGFVASGFADRFDRKRFLLFFYTGFIVGTLLCGLAPTYSFLLVARVVTGLFGGVVGSIAFAIVTDIFPPGMRGRVMGFIQTAFAASQVLGIPAGLYLSNHLGWHAPFFAIVAFGVAVGALIILYVKPIDTHLQHGVDKSAFHHLAQTLSTPRYLQAFATTALLSIGGFMLMPFGSAFSVRNLGITTEQLPLVYLVTGICSIVAGPLVGRLADSWGSFRVFALGSLLTLVMVIIYTHLGVTPLNVVILVSVFLFVGVSARMISSQALISTIPAPASRGAFMSVGSSIQQVSGGIGAALAGWIIVAPQTGPLLHFDVVGFLIAGATVITVAMMFLLNRSLTAQK
jgi:predicted MFS family arabinose efflux permease